MADLIERDAAIDCLDSNTFDSYENAVMTLHKIEDIPPVNRWISVEDALPDAFIYVICAGEEGMAILRYNGEVWVDDAGCMYPMSAITHWMSLPELPKRR